MDDWGIDELINKGGVMILTPEQESLIGDDAYHEKKLMEEIAKEKKQYKKIPINSDRFNQILIKIGRKKHDPETIS